MPRISTGLVSRLAQPKLAGRQKRKEKPQILLLTRVKAKSLVASGRTEKPIDDE